MNKDKLDLSLVVSLTKFKRSRQICQGVADRYPRNKLCPCGSKKKYKKCCWSKGNAPGKKFHSPIFWDTFIKDATYSQKQQRKMDNDDR